MDASIIIPTANRLKLVFKLIQTLDFFLHESNYNFDVIIIINGEQKELALSTLNVNWRARINAYTANQNGSSFPRNKAIKLTQSPWLIFLDDDVHIDKSFLIKAKQVIQSNQFDCFGGTYYPWYPNGKPKWLPIDFGKKKLLRPDIGLINLPEDGFLSAGIMAIKKEVLENIGEFRTDLGMGKNIGYGEENELQLRIQSAGYRIGFIPDWYMQHAVLPHKHKVNWHLKAAYAQGRDRQRIYKEHSLSHILYKLIGGIFYSFIIKLPKALYKWIFQKEYYWQNGLLFVCQSIFVTSGRLKGYQISKKTTDF